MKWSEIKASYMQNHIGRNEETDHVRLRAWKKMEEMLAQHFADTLLNPPIILKTGRQEFKNQFARLKSNKKLNSAEIAIINFLFNTLSQK